MKTLQRRICQILFASLSFLGGGSPLAVSAAQEPGAVTIVLPVEPETLDPSLMTKTIEGRVLSRNVLETLTDMRVSDNVIIPRLATSWERVDDLTWRFEIRQGVKFHDGTDLDATDVVHSLERLYDKTYRLSEYFNGVALKASVLGPYTVGIKSEKLEPLVPTLMSFMPIVPASPENRGKLLRDPIGTGPYKLVGWDAGKQIVVERFPGYWGEQPKVEKATYIWRQESAVRAAMVELGEADLVPDIAFEDANNPATDKSYLNAGTVLLRITGFDNPPFNDRRVRLALNYAVNRGAIIGSLVPKEAVPSAQPLPPGTFGFNADLKPWPYDPDLARKLLKEAKDDGVPVDKLITIPSRIGHFPKSEEVLEAVAGMLTEVGLNVQLVPVETGVFRAKYARKPYPTEPHIVAIQLENSGGDAAFSALVTFACEGMFSRTCDKPLEDLIQKAKVASGEERRSLWHAVFKRTHDELVTDIDLYHEVLYARVGKRITYTPNIKTGSELQLGQISFVGH